MTFSAIINSCYFGLPIGLLDPRLNPKDGGIFAASGKSLLANPTFATTFFVSGEEQGAWVKGNTRR